MKTVGLRQLKNNLSAYVRKARAGETIRVTDRGQVVARLVPEPVESDDPIERGLADLERRGLLVRRPLKKATKDDYPVMPRIVPEGTAQRLLDETRGDT